MAREGLAFVKELLSERLAFFRRFVTPPPPYKPTIQEFGETYCSRFTPRHSSASFSTLPPKKVSTAMASSPPDLSSASYGIKIPHMSVARPCRYA